MKVEYFPRKIGLFHWEIWSYRRTVSGRVIEKFPSLKRLDGCMAKSIKFEILGCMEALEDCKSVKVEHFRINILDFEEKYGKISACRAFNCFQTVSGRRTFGPFIAGTSATLTVCVTMVICCFAWTTTSTTLSSASSSPRGRNFNWPLVLFNNVSKPQRKKIDVWMKSWWINILPSSEYL